MMLFRLPLMLLFCHALIGQVFAQNVIIDSLESELSSSPEINEDYIDILNTLAFEHIKVDPKKGMKMVARSIQLSDSIQYTTGTFRAIVHRGSAFWMNGLYDEALQDYLKALTLKVDDKEGHEFLLNNIGETYKKKGLMDSALVYLNKSLNLAYSRDSSAVPPLIASNIAEVYFEMEQYDSAKRYFDRSLTQSLAVGNERGESYAYYGLGDIARRRGLSDRAMSLHQEAYKIRRLINDKRAIVQSLIRLSELKMDVSANSQAHSYLEEALQVAQSIESAELQQTIYFEMYEFYNAQKDYQLANNYLGIYHRLKDSLETVAFQSRIGTIKDALQSEVHEAENKLLKEQKSKQEQSSSIQVISLIAATIIVFILLAYLYQYYKRFDQTKLDSEKLAQLNKLIVRKNNEIEAINQRLDSKLLNTNKMLAESQQISKLGSWEYEVKTNEIHWTEETYNQLGLQPGSVVPSIKEFKRYANPDDFSVMKQAIQDCMEQQKEFETEVRVTNARDQHVILRLKFIPEFEDGQLVRMYGTNLDITKSVNEEIQEKRIIDSLLKLSRAASLHEFAFDIFLEDLLKTATKTIGVDRCSLWLYDYDMDALVCKKLFDSKQDHCLSGQIFYKKDYPQYFEAITKNRTINVKDVYVDEDTSEFREYLFEVGITSKLDVQIAKDGNLLGVLSFATTSTTKDWSYSDQRYAGSLSDIINTAINSFQNKKLEKEKSRLIEKLVRKNQNLQEFAYVISHNLREPVAQIMGLTQVYNHPDSVEIQDEIFKRIDDASARLDQVIKDLSAVLINEEGENYELERVSLDSMVENAMTELETKVIAAGPTIHKHYDLEFVLYSNKSFLSNIIFQLISNAVKFRDHSRPLEISINAETSDNDYSLVIQDNGLGMDLQGVEQKLFKMYQRFHESTEGRGVGLYLVKNQVQLLGGNIYIESEPNKGTKVSIVLPRRELDPVTV